MTTETDIGGQDEELRSAQSQPISDGLRPTTSGAGPSAAKRAPVQGYSPGIPWEMHLRAYDAYCKRWSPQPALIDLEGRNCRGGFGTEELDQFIPGWRDELSDRRKMEAALQSAQSEAAALRVERDELRELVPTPLNTWGARGYEVDYSRAGPGATPRWCLGLNGVGHVPIAWFYRKADAERFAASEAREAALRERVGELEKGLERIRDESIFNQQRFAEDDDSDYFLRCFRAVKDFAAQLLKDKPNGWAIVSFANPSFSR